MESLIPAMRWSLVLALVGGALPATAQMVPSAAPVNPVFLARQREREVVKQGATPQLSSPTHRLGYAPSPVDLSHVQGVLLNHRAMAGFPTSYDLRSLSQVPAIRNQNPFGDCWAFASLGSLESSLLKSGQGTFDLSEWHLAWFVYNDLNSNMVAFTKGSVDAGSDETYDQGGNNWQSTAILARGTGAVSESSCLYNSGSYPTGNEANVVSLEQVLYMGQDVVDATNVKTALQEYGALSVSLNADTGMQNSSSSTNYNASTHAFRDTTSTYQNTNHLIDIVGWNDNYPATNFPSSNQPSSNGAWIARNSWSKSWGDSGYFYISYDSKVFEGTAFVGSPRKWTHVYQYDPLGWTQNLGYTKAPDPSTAYCANIFTSVNAEPITAVSFYSTTANATYEIRFRTGVTGDPTTGTLLSGSAWPQTGALTAPGYHTIDLASPVTVTPGQKFAVVLKLTSPGFSYPICVESTRDGYSDKATANAGEGYMSYDGNSWSDINQDSPNTNICLKAFSGFSLDLDASGLVDVEDMAVLCRTFGLTSSATGYSSAADLNGDGTIDNSDITLFVKYF